MSISDPTDISGCVLWLDADQIALLSDGDPVSTWDDNSGANNDGTQTSTARPTYQTAELNSKPVVRFDGMDDYFNLASPLPNPPFSFFAVIKPSGFGGYRTIMAGGITSGADWQLITSTGKQGLTKNSIVAIGDSGTALSTSDFQIVAVTYDGSAFEFRLGGATDGSGTNAQTLSQLGSFIGTNSGFQQFFAGDIAEVIAYDSVLSSGNRADVEAYLTAKWFGGGGGGGNRRRRAIICGAAA